MKTKHSSLPWELSTTKLGDPAIYPTANPKMFICVFAGEGDTDKANAAFIVEAVNSYAALQADNAELREALRLYGHHDLSCVNTVTREDGECSCGFEQALASERKV